MIRQPSFLCRSSLKSGKDACRPRTRLHHPRADAIRRQRCGGGGGGGRLVPRLPQHVQIGRALHLFELPKVGRVRALALAVRPCVSIALRPRERPRRRAPKRCGLTLTLLVRQLPPATPLLLLGSCTTPLERLGRDERAALAQVFPDEFVRLTPPTEPDEPSRAWRGVLKTILAGPLGLAAAVAIAYCAAAWVPGAPPTRVLIGGLTIPIVWALALIWTLADPRLMRSLAMIVTTTLTGFALAALQGPV